MKIEYANHEHLKEIVSKFADFAPEQGTVELHEKKERTLTQNAAMHKYFAMLSNDLNNQGQMVSGLIKDLPKLAEVPWTPELVKELIWKRFQKALTDKDSTADLETHEVNKVYESVSMNLAKIAGVNTDFPHQEE